MNLWDAVKAVPITQVAEDLDVKIVSDKGPYVVALCPFHEDHLGGGGKPNLSLLKAKNSFKCFVCGAHGTVIDFWSQLLKVTPEAAVHAMSDKYHIQAPAEEPVKPKKKPQPKKKGKDETWNQARIEAACEELFKPENEHHLQNLCKVRHLTPEYVKEKKIGLAWVPGIKLAYTIPAFDTDGKILSIRTHSRASRKDKRFVSGFTSKFLYDLTSYDPNGEELWICEGEPDLWTLEHKLKKNVLSSFAGSNTIPKIVSEQKEKLGDLAKKTRIVLCPDNDYAGRDCMAWIRYYLPKEAKVEIVEWPPQYEPKEDVSFWFNTQQRSLEEFESIIKIYSWEDANTYITKQVEHKKAASTGRPVYEFGGCYFRKKPKKQSEEVDEGASIDDINDFSNRISNFVIHGKATVRVDRAAYTRVDVSTFDGQVEKDVFLPPDAWRSRSKMVGYLQDTKYEFTGSDNDLQHIMTLATEKINTNQVKKGVEFIGFDEGYFVGPGFALDKNGSIEDPPVEYIPQGLPFDDNIKIYPSDEVKDVMQKFSDVILAVNKPHVIIPTLGWMFACFFKEKIRERLNYFPIMSFFGTSGAGKTSFVTSILRMFGIRKGLMLFNANESAFVSMRMLSCTNCIPVAVDELKEDIGREGINQWRRRARSSYSGEIEMRGRQDLSVKSYPYRAPLLVIGEMSLVREQAITERTIAVEPKRSDIGEVEREAFKMFQKDVPMEVLFPSIIQWCLAEGHPGMHDLWSKSIQDLMDLKLPWLPDRVWDNMTTVIFGINAFEAYAKSVGVKFQVDQDRRRDAISFLTSKILSVAQRTKMGFDELLEALANMAITGDIKSKIHYDRRGEWLYLHLPGCSAAFREWARKTQYSKEILDEKEYRNQASEIEKMSYGRYVHAISKMRKLDEGRSLRTIQINLKRAERCGLDITGFGYTSEVTPNEWEEEPPETTEDIDSGKPSPPPETQLPLEMRTEEPLPQEQPQEEEEDIF